MSAFFSAALRDIKQTGSFAPSSRFLAARMTQFINFDKTLKIVELGAGEGIFTRHILSQMKADSSLISFEINPLLFCEIVQIEDKRLQPVLESALQISDYASENSVDYIISGIPLANMKKEDKEDLLLSCHRLLKPGGAYVQFQYSLNDFRLIKRSFEKVQLGFTFWNFPSAFVYYATKNKKLTDFSKFN